MANLTVDTPREYELTATDDTYPYAHKAQKTYQGAALTDSGSPGSATGNAGNLTAGENFLGFAELTQDDSSSTDGINTILIKAKGTLRNVTVTGLAASSLGASVYMSDNNTFTLTSTSNTLIGTVKRMPTSTTADIGFAGKQMKVG